MKSELDLFTLPPTQTTIESSHWVQYKPISSLTDDSPIEFTIPGNGDEYLNLAHTMLSIRARIEMDADLEPEEHAKIKEIGPVNNFIHASFSQVDVYFNQKPVSPPNNAYAYRAYIETLLNYNTRAKNTHLGTVVWYNDTAGQMESTTENEGLVQRRKLLAKNSIDMIGHLHCDVFNQDKLLLNGVDVGIRLVMAREGFAIMDPTKKCNVRISEATLHVRRVKVNPVVMMGHANGLTKYPLTCVQIKSIAMHAGVHGEILDNVILGGLPKRIIIGFGSNKAFNADRALNPFNFHHYYINYLPLYVDGKSSKPLQPDFQKTTNCYVEAYQSLFSGTGVHFLNHGDGITRTDYANGYCLFAFDLRPDLSANDATHWNLIVTEVSESTYASIEH